MDVTSSVIVGYDYKGEGDNAVLIVGQKQPNQVVQIINAFHGDEAKELWKKLTVKEEK